MARINIDDDLESTLEFKTLIDLLSQQPNHNIWFTALGMLVVFERIAQTHYVDGIPISREMLIKHRLGLLIDAECAVPSGDGYQIKNPEKHFAWLNQKIEAGRRGGLTKEANKKLAGAKRALADAYPLAPSPSLSPSLSPDLKKEYIYISSETEAFGQKHSAKMEEPPTRHPITLEQVQSCTDVWGRTLKKLGVHKDPRLDETDVGRLIQLHGFEKTRLALTGAGNEAAGDGFDPRKHVSIKRLYKPSVFDKFVNLGSQVEPNRGIRPIAELLDRHENIPLDPNAQQKIRAIIERAQPGLRSMPMGDDPCF